MRILCVALGLGSLGLFPSGLSPAVAQPASTFQPGFFQPRVRINPAAPLRVRIENRLGARVDYENVESQAPPLPILPGQSLVLEGLPVPSFINVATPNFSPYREISTLFDLSTEANNTLVVRVRESGDYFGGERVIQVDAQGGVYVF
ncbi:MAG: hypothetical protein OHK0012_07840 [Synechococcales cyanobacterium]